MLNSRIVISGLLYFLFPFIREEMHTKLDVIKANGKQIEESLTTFDVSITSVIHALTAEGTKIKAMIDRRLEITSFILDILWPLCLPVTHLMQIETLHLSQRK
jgi:hypothetical protein